MAQQKYFENQLTATEAAYIAGIVDGEGTLGVSRYSRKENKSGYRFQIFLAITSTNKELLEWLTKTTGLGAFHEKKESSIRAKRRCWKWSLKFTQAARLLIQISPYMIIKKDQALNCIAFDNAIKSSGNYKNYDIEMMNKFWIKSGELNARGELLDMNNPVVSAHKGLAKIHENHFATFDQPAAGT